MHQMNLEFIIILGSVISVPFVCFIGYYLAKRSIIREVSISREKEEVVVDEITKKSSGKIIGKKTAANRILVVEDDASVSSSMKMILEKSGYAVTIVDLARDTLAAVKNYEFNAILLDLALPDASGHDVLRSMRKDGVNVPIIIVTGTERDPSSGFAEGANDYILKPFGAEELSGRVGAAIRSSFGVFGTHAQIGEIEFDFSLRKALVNGEKLVMSSTEMSFWNFSCFAIMKEQLCK